MRDVVISLCKPTAVGHDETNPSNDTAPPPPSPPLCGHLCVKVMHIHTGCIPPPRQENKRPSPMSGAKTWMRGDARWIANQRKRATRLEKHGETGLWRSFGLFFSFLELVLHLKVSTFRWKVKCLARTSAAVPCYPERSAILSVGHAPPPPQKTHQFHSICSGLFDFTALCFWAHHAWS